MNGLKAPFPYFGGKSRVAAEVWRRFGDVRCYVEPFFGSGAVLLARPQPFEGVETVNDLDGLLCLAPESRLLRFDLSWAQAGDVKVGDELLAFDESNGSAREGLRAPTRYRHWRPTTVVAVRRVVKPCYRLTFDDGTTVIASSDHMWLGGSHKTGGRGWRWQRTDGLVCNRATQRSWILKLCDVVEREDSFDAGWLAGFYDGEGHLRNGPGWRLNVCQKLGPEADRAAELLAARGFDVVKSVRERESPKHQPIAHFEINGGMRATLRFLMQIRPERMIRAFQSHATGMSLYGRSHQAVGLISKEFLGDREVVAVETTSHTFIAEGLASHNCNFWRALKADPVAVAEAADWPVSECDLTARHLWLVERRESITERLCADPDWYDAKAAGWWVWGACAWIGSGWCTGDGPWVRGADGLLTKIPHLGNAGLGINRQIPHLGDAGRVLVDDLTRLSNRLRRVRVCSGSWERVLSDSVTWRHGTCGVFLDPPYDTGNIDYGAGGMGLGLAAEVRAWAIKAGERPDMRIALCGYDEHAELATVGWTLHRWSAKGGYSSPDGENKNRHAECVWFSPACLKPEESVFDIFGQIND